MFLERIFGRSKPATTAPKYPIDAENADYKKIIEDLILYPPKPMSLRYIPDHEMFRFYQVAIADLCMALGTNPEQFRTRFAPFIYTTINYYGLLPASQRHHHHLPGGALAHALDVATRAVQTARSASFRPQRLYVNQAELKADLLFIAFLAGLWHDVGKPVTDLSVAIDEKKWFPGIESLSQFLLRNNIQEYSVTWSEFRQHNEHVSASPSIVGRWLSTYRLELSPELYALLMDGIACDPSTFMGKIILQADGASVADSMRRFPSLGQPALPHSQLIDALTLMITSGEATVNQRNSKILYFNSSLHLAWPSFCDDLASYVRKTRRDFISSFAPDTVAQLLRDARLLSSTLADCVNVFPLVFPGDNYVTDKQVLTLATSLGLEHRLPPQLRVHKETEPLAVPVQADPIASPTDTSSTATIIETPVDSTASPVDTNNDKPAPSPSLPPEQASAKEYKKPANPFVMENAQRMAKDMQQKDQAKASRSPPDVSAHPAPVASSRPDPRIPKKFPFDLPANLNRTSRQLLEFYARHAEHDKPLVESVMFLAANGSYFVRTEQLIRTFMQSGETDKSLVSIFTQITNGSGFLIKSSEDHAGSCVVSPPLIPWFTKQFSYLQSVSVLDQSSSKETNHV